MPDIYQDGFITNLHRFGSSNLNDLEEELYHFSQRRPIALVLPAVPGYRRRRTEKNIKGIEKGKISKADCRYVGASR